MKEVLRHPFLMSEVRPFLSYPGMQGQGDIREKLDENYLVLRIRPFPSQLSNPALSFNPKGSLN